MAYKRGIEEDEKLLESTQSLTTKHILKLCICEKKLLRLVSDCCRDKIHSDQNK